MTDEDGRLLGMIAVISDVDERKKDLERLRIAATVFEASNDGILVTDAENHIVSVNPAFTALTGFSVAEAVGQTPALLKSGRHPPEFYAEMWRSLAASDRWEDRKSTR